MWKLMYFLPENYTIQVYSFNIYILVYIQSDKITNLIPPTDSISNKYNRKYSYLYTPHFAITRKSPLILCHNKVQKDKKNMLVHILVLV